MADVTRNYDTDTARIGVDAPGLRTDYTTITEYNRYNAIRPLDRVRWAPVLAGLLTVYAAMTVFAVLGLALGLSTLDVNNPRGLVLGAGIYGIITSLLAFAFGGFIAGRSSAVVGTQNGILNGAMVWISSVVLMVTLLTSGIGMVIGLVPETASAAAQTANVVNDVAPNAVQQGVDSLESAAQEAATDAGAAVGTTDTTVEDTAANGNLIVQNPLQDVTPEQVEQTAQDVSAIAWTGLLALGLTAFAAIIGGVLGSRVYADEYDEVRRTTPA
jgi:hypothetical protein